MFLNFRRVHIKYVVLWILTLGMYSYFFRREITYDINTCVGEKRIKAPTAKFFFMNLITLGYYGRYWDIEALNILEEYIKKNESEKTVDYEYYRFMLKIPFARVAGVSHFIDILNEACYIYSELQLQELEGDDYLAENRVREVSDEIMYGEEAPAYVPKIFHEKPVIDDGDVHRIAGHAVVEEYDPSKDYKRISYKLRLEREARAAAKAAALNPNAKPKEVKAKELTVIVEEPPIECKRKSGRWLVARFSALLAIFLVPLIIIGAIVVVTPPVYDETYLGVIGDKYERLSGFTEPKIVVIGGSSAAFGLDSNLLYDTLESVEAVSGMPIVNLGLYGDMGLKFTIDIAKANIGEGDIIILAPEISDKMLSLYVDGERVLKSLDGNLEMFRYVGFEDYGSLLGSSFSYISEKLSYLFGNKTPLPENELYQKKYFNKSGDIVNGYRPYNVMTEVAKTIDFDYKADLSDTKVTAYDEFIEYVNKFSRYCQRKGATLYFSFAPMNESALVESCMLDDDGKNNKIDRFYRNLCETLECEIISDVYDYIIEDGYFYDTEFHLNDSGVILRTKQLVDDIKRALNDHSLTDITVPQAPGRENGGTTTEG